MRKSILKCTWMYAADIKNRYFQDKNIGGIRVNEKVTYLQPAFVSMQIYTKPKIREHLYFIEVLPKILKRYGDEVIIRCDLHLHQHTHDTCRAYLKCFCISLLSESAAIPPDVQHYHIKQKETKKMVPLFLHLCIVEFCYKKESVICQVNVSSSIMDSPLYLLAHLHKLLSTTAAKGIENLIMSHLQGATGVPFSIHPFLHIFVCPSIC